VRACHGRGVSAIGAVGVEHGHACMSATCASVCVAQQACWVCMECMVIGVGSGAQTRSSVQELRAGSVVSHRLESSLSQARIGCDRAKVVRVVG